MLTLTIRDVDDALEAKLRRRASLHHRTIEEEVREIISELADDEPTAASFKAASNPKFEERVRRVLSLGRSLDGGFDLKAFSDELSDPIG